MLLSSRLPRAHTLLLAGLLSITAAALLPSTANAVGVQHLDKRLHKTSHALIPRQLFGGSSSDDGGEGEDGSSTSSNDFGFSSTTIISPFSTSQTSFSSSTDTAAAASSSASAASASLSSAAAAASSSAAQLASQSAAQASQSAAAASSQSLRSASLASASAASASSLAAALSRSAAAQSSHSQATSAAVATTTDGAGSVVVVTSIVAPTSTSSSSGSSSSSSSGSHTALIAGVSGAVGGLALLGGLAYFLMRFTGKRNGFDDADADIKWPELKHGEGDMAAMQPLPARRTGGAGFDMGEDIYSDVGHGSRLDGEDGMEGGQDMLMSEVARTGGYGDSTVHFTGAGAYGGVPLEYASNLHDFGAAPDYLSTQNGPGGGAGYYDDYSPPGASGREDQRVVSNGDGTAAGSGPGATGGAYTAALVEPDLSSPHAFMSGYDDGGYGIAAVTPGVYQDHRYDDQYDQQAAAPPPPPREAWHGYSDAPSPAALPSSSSVGAHSPALYQQQQQEQQYGRYQHNNQAYDHV